MSRLPVRLFVRQFRRDWEVYTIKFLTLSMAFASALLAIAFASAELTVNSYHAADELAGRVLKRNETKDYYKNRTSDRVTPEVFNALSHSKGVVVSRTKFMEQVSVVVNGKLFAGESIHLTDTGISAILSLKSLKEQGPIDTTGVLLSASTALRFFGSEEIRGKTLMIFALGDTLNIKVSGVFKDPQNAHEAWRIFVPFSTANLAMLGSDDLSFSLYFRANDQQVIADLEKTINDQFKGQYVSYRLQSLGDIYFGPRVVGERARHGDSYSVFILLCISGLIFFLALTNYTNLTTLTLPKRSTELAIKKVAGAKAVRLVMQLLSESLFICFLSLISGSCILLLSEEVLKEYVGIDLFAWIAHVDLTIIMVIVLVFVFTALAPVYPALRFAHATPVRLLSSVVITFPVFKRIITITQLGISISLIVAGLVVQRQIGRSLIKEPGKNQDQVVYLKYPAELTKLEEVKGNWRRNNPNIVEVTAASQLPNNIQSKVLDGGYYRISVDKDFITFFDIAKTSGWWFGVNDTSAVVVNELARSGGINGIGVIENFGSMFNQPERPLVIESDDKYSFLFIRILEVNIRDTQAYLHRFFREYTGHDVDIYFMDKKFEAGLTYEDTLNKLSELLSIIAGIMACCAIYALSLNRVNDTLKQIAIRTTFGATRFNIIFMLSRDFFQLLLASVLFFGPVTFLLLREWLRNFAYAAHIKWSDPIIGLAVCLTIVALTNGALIHKISKQTLSAALRQ